MYVRRRRRIGRGAWVIGIVIVFGAIAVFAVFNILSSQQQAAMQPIPTATGLLLPSPPPATATPITAAGAVTPAAIDRLIIAEKAKLNAEIMIAPFGKTVNWEISMLQQRAGHLEGTPDIGQGGNVVLAGHVEMEDGAPGPFAYLRNLQPGDSISIVIRKDNKPQILFYAVTEVKDVAPDDISVMRNHGFEELTLITCDDWDQGQGKYLSRVIVHARPTDRP
jgi:LPXTG-site transpeptidase (sortase) family protein